MPPGFAARCSHGNHSHSLSSVHSDNIMPNLMVLAHAVAVLVLPDFVPNASGLSDSEGG